MHVLIVTNARELEDRHWGMLKRLGRVHYGRNLYGHGEVYLQLPWPRRSTAREYQALLPPQGILVKGAYRPQPRFAVELPVLRLHPLDYSERFGHPTGLYSIAHHTGIPCPWCLQGEMRAIAAVNTTVGPNRWHTVFFCYGCQRIVRIQDQVPREDWEAVADYIQDIPRPRPLRADTTTWWTKEIRRDVRRRSARYKRDYGLGGISTKSAG